LSESYVIMDTMRTTVYYMRKLPNEDGVYIDYVKEIRFHRVRKLIYIDSEGGRGCGLDFFSLRRGLMEAIAPFYVEANKLFAEDDKITKIIYTWDDKTDSFLQESVYD